MSTEDESPQRTAQRPAQRPAGGQQRPASRRVASTREAEESEEEILTDVLDAAWYNMTTHG